MFQFFRYLLPLHVSRRVQLSKTSYQKPAIKNFTKLEKYVIFLLCLSIKALMRMEIAANVAAVRIKAVRFLVVGHV